MQDLVLRRPTIEDVNPLDEFYKFVLKDTFIKNGIADLVDDYDKAVEEKRKYIIEDLESNGEQRYFLIATIDGNIIGSIEYGPSNDDINNSTGGLLKNITEIGSVFVHPNYQRKGIGSLMLAQMYSELNRKGIKEFCLDSGYKIAQKVWIKKFGNPEYHFVGFWGEGTNYMIWRVKIENVLN